MDPGLRTPLIDFFRRGEVARDVRLLAAHGAMAPRALEQLALLVLLADDQEPAVAAAAGATIAALPERALTSFLARTDVPEEIRQFFAERGVRPAPHPDPVPDDEPLFEVGTSEEEAATERDTPVANLSILDRMKLAMKGTREQRQVLIRDPNKIVAAAVLSSPKLTKSEIESFARMANVAEDVLRTIGMNRSWTKNYSVISALARNPKTPPAISLGLVGRLNERDIKNICTDRNVPEALRLAARKFLVKGKGKGE
ncbi:MAG: hypothetical protein ACRD1S_02260 [Vicinamibacterales bacterium]